MVITQQPAESRPDPGRHLVRAIDLATDRARNSRAPNTRRAYESDWRDFLAACSELGLTPDPTPATLAVYIDQLARRGAKVSTIRRRLAAINTRLRLAGREAVTARAEPLASVLRGVRREIGAPPTRARPIEVDELRAILGACGGEVAGLRDRALLLLGFAGAFRRSELAGLTWAADSGGQGHISFVPEGARVTLRRSKTNQVGDFEEVAICRGAVAATCPVRALEAWAAVSAPVGGGPVFRPISRHGLLGPEAIDGRAVERIIRRAVRRASLALGASESECQTALAGVSGHSLRAGLVTTAFASGLSAEDVMRQTRHRDVKTLLGYRRHATAFVANVSGRVGL